MTRALGRARQYAACRTRRDRARQRRDAARQSRARCARAHSTVELTVFVHWQRDGKDRFDAVMAAVKSVPVRVQLGKDGRGERRFTSRTIIEIEKRLERFTGFMANRDQHAVLDRIATPRARCGEAGPSAVRRTVSRARTRGRRQGARGC